MKWPFGIFARLSSRRLTPGLRVGRTHVVEFLGRGATACVWALRHPEHGDCALKVAHGAALPFERFRREASWLERIRSRHVPSLCGAGVLADGAAFVAMSRAPDVVLSRRTWTPQHALGLARQALFALRDVHAAGVVHGDVKLDNLRGTHRGCQLVDFGVACEIGQPNRLDDGAPGTLPYMAPEQLRGDGLGPETDLYSLAVLLYRTLTGVFPFAASSPRVQYEDQLAAAYVPIGLVRPDAPRALDLAMRSWLCADRARRPSSADEMRHTLEEVAHRWPQDAWRRPSMPPRRREGTTRRRAVVAG
ncbi:MAG: serine/threonine protein kinase [Sandaracinus sp.]|nr:serine/threonine protein kinase [Sandaracinus sp.]MCB9632649.1 serine/threonine protein kinase [Sandaracinus sp.]